MNRRDFFTLTRRASASSVRPSVGIRHINAGLTPYSGAWTSKEIAHLLKRTMFGAKKADIDHFGPMSPGAAVDELLNVSATMPAPPLKFYTSNPDDGVATGTTWVNSIPTADTPNGERINSWKNWWIGQMLNQDRTVREKMTLFWHNHFATEASMYEHGRFAYIHNNLLRTNALGNFKTLTRAVTLDPAMLKYLNGVLNHKNAPDENYARELQELFTLGKENNPNYTEDDVQAAAKVLTGWRIKSEDETVFFEAGAHDTTTKTFSSFFGGATVASGTGDVELDALLNMIFAKTKEVSEFIVKKLYTWFCYYTITDEAYNTVIVPLAQQLVAGSWEVKPVLATLLKSDHFFDPLTQGCLIKSPLEMTIGMFREFEVVFPTDPAVQYGMWDYIRNQVSLLQQNPGDPPSVSGWPAYHQIPMFYEMWINHDTMPRRERLIDQIVGNGYSRDGAVLKIDSVAFTQSVFGPVAGDPNALINAVLDLLYRVPISETSKGRIKQDILLNGLTTDNYWSTAWSTYLGSPTDPMAVQAVQTRLTALYKKFMNLAEYQLA